MTRHSSTLPPRRRPVEGEVLLENPIHPREAGKFGGQIDAIGPPGVAVDLLERDRVRSRMADHRGDPLQVDLPVHAAAMLDVVAEHRQSQRALCLLARSRAAGPRGRERENQNPQ